MAIARRHPVWMGLLSLDSPRILALMVVGFVLWTHWGADVPVFRSHASLEPGWEQFKAAYRVNAFGDDGYFVRATQNGHNVFYSTPKYAWRFTRKSGKEQVHACAHCHRSEDMAYSLVNSDRFDARLGRRVAFEERIMRCFTGPMDGFVPTLYDPTVRDLRIFARAVAHHLQLAEGAPAKELRPSIRQH